MATLEPRLLLLCAVVCLFAARESEAVLTLRQGRIVSTPAFDLEIFDIAGIATVELGGNVASRPTYFFDCITNLNNGSGITWTRMTTQNTFEIEPIPDGTTGMRLDATDIDYMHLDIYTCSDRYSDESVSVNITGSNPAIMAAEETVSVVQGLTVELEIYVSGFPLPTESSITWQYPDGTPVMNTDFEVQLQSGGRRLILSNVQPARAGTYQCSVIISLSPYMGASTSIQLDVYVPITIVAEPTASTVQEWNKVTLNCSARGVPVPHVTWEREDGSPLPSGAQMTTSMTSTTTHSGLVLNMTRYGDRGRYRCVANNGQSNAAMSQYADLQVTPALRLVDGGMQVVSDIYSVQNEANVNLECFGTGTLQWTSSTGLEISTDSTANIYQSYDQSSDALALTIKSFSSADTATYTCTTDLAVNGPLTSSVLITSSNPAVVIRSSVQYVLRDTSTTLEARVFASPSTAAVNWYHQGTLINTASDNRYTTSSSGDIYSLTVSSVSEAEIGEYTIVVSLNGVTANDTIRLAFPVSPTATISPPSISVNEGELVRLVCEVTGSGPLNVSWTLSDGSPLPLGVQENGNEIVIAAATSSHPGTYVCSVSNLAGTRRDEATVTVYYSPEVVIEFGEMISTPNEPLYLVRNDGDQGPTVTCMASGNPTPSVSWTQENGRGLPSGIIQTTLASGDVELRWQRPMEFTDSGSYICQAIGSGITSTATLDVLVQIEPEISSIYPFSSDIMQGSQTFSYVVPLSYEGIALVCGADGWPAPEVEWQKDGQPLPSSSGIVSESSTMAATVSARLRWSREFHSSDTGSYECVVRKPNTVVPVDSQTVELKVGPSTITGAPLDCSIDQTSVFFQIRIFGTDCTSWDGSLSTQIAADFRDEILSVVRTECSCQVDESELEVLGSPQCSRERDGAAVFRGQIQTTSQTRTEQAYCALYSWQQRSPLIRINEQFRAVDPTCSLLASGSLDSQECAAPGEKASFGMLEIAYIIGAAALVLVVLVLVLLICVIVCYCYQRSGRKEFDIDAAESTDHTYARTDSFTKYGKSVGRTPSHTGPGGEEPVYSTLTRDTEDSPQRTESISLSLIKNQSSQKLISESTDGRKQPSTQQRPPPLTTTTESYQIPINSQESLTPGSVIHFTAAQRQTTSSSAYNTTSHARISPVQRTRPSVSPVDDGGTVSASSPFNDYEHIDGDECFSQSSSFCESPTTPINAPDVPSRQKGSFKLRQSPRSPRQFEIGGVSASAQGGINPHYHDQSVFAVAERGENGERRLAAAAGTTSVGRMVQGGETASSHYREDGRQSPKGSTGSSSPHAMKRTLMAQFQSTDNVTHLQVRGSETSSEAPPPYSSRPASDAVLSTESSDPSMIDSRTYSSPHRPWYQATSDASLGGQLTTTTPTKTGGDQIQPYAVLHGELALPTSQKSGDAKVKEAIVRRTNSQTKSSFQAKQPVQPYAEPVRSSVASLGHAQESPTFFEVVV